MGERRYSSILGLGTRWVWSASLPGRFTSGKIPPVTHWIGGWVAHSRSGRYGEAKNLAPTGNRSPAVQTVARR
jgi:hypothetical protein